MKRIFALILALTLVFALVSCKGDEVQQGVKVDVDSYKNAIAATKLNTAKVEVTQANDFIPEHPLTAEYNITYAEDGSATVEYTYSEYNEIAEDGAEDFITVHKGSAEIAADGTVTGDPVGTAITSAASIGFNLDPSKMISCTESMGILTAKIAAANTAAVIGVAVDAEVTLTISVANGVVVGATVSYVIGAGSYTIECTYN